MNTSCTAHRDVDRRVDAAVSLHNLKRTNEWLNNLVTGDEKWVLYSNHYHRGQWVDEDAKADGVPRPDKHGKMVMLCVWWSVRGVEYWELLDKRTMVTTEHDNARPHTARMTKVELATYSWTILPHTLYSPDLAPSDGNLFSHLQRYLDDQNFIKFDDVKNALETFYSSQPASFWSEGVYDQPSR
ncbi:unnamed protein product [Nippostrongylus brasiliensis]|uniref:Mariner Mos1 transposase n=1 Tax=Nippostrongylus brasiliensis TaxID=27835 RepID=A0A0N4XDI3_NIPBR|nr:unnamed protein product [Nippostrongylus brasiliensis]